MEVKKSPACRKKNETKSECVSRKIPEILGDNPGMSNKQAVAIAESMCSKTCRLLDDTMDTNMKYMTKSKAQEVRNVDYLTLPEITKRVVKQIRPDLLYRTHMAIHAQASTDMTSKKLQKAHKIVADELLSRGFMHHQWDKLDTFYTQE